MRERLAQRRFSAFHRRPARSQGTGDVPAEKGEISRRKRGPTCCWQTGRVQRTRRRARSDHRPVRSSAFDLSQLASSPTTSAIRARERYLGSAIIPIERRAVRRPARQVRPKARPHHRALYRLEFAVLTSAYLGRAAHHAAGTGDASSTRSARFGATRRSAYVGHARGAHIPAAVFAPYLGLLSPFVFGYRGNSRG